MKYIKAILLLIAQPFIFLGEGLLAIALLFWAISGCGFLLILGDISENDKITWSWFIIIVDAMLLILYCADFVKDKVREYEKD